MSWSLCLFQPGQGPRVQGTPMLPLCVCRCSCCVCPAAPAMSPADPAVCVQLLQLCLPLIPLCVSPTAPVVSPAVPAVSPAAPAVSPAVSPAAPAVSPAVPAVCLSRGRCIAACPAVSLAMVSRIRSVLQGPWIADFTYDQKHVLYVAELTLFLARYPQANYLTTQDMLCSLH